MKKFIIVMLALALITCTEEEVTSRNYPRIRTYDVDRITSNSATFSGEITFLKGTVTDHGFYWSVNPFTDVPASAEQVSLGATTVKGRFTTVIERSLDEGTTYYVRAYARSADHLVFGDQVKFVSLGSKAPVLFSISPAQAHWGDTLFVRGKNFSISKNFKVLFGEVQSSIIRYSDSLVTVAVPEDLLTRQSDVTVSLSGNVSTLPGFELLTPVATSIDPVRGKYNDVVTIDGVGFNRKHTTVTFGDLPAVVDKQTRTQVKFKVPLGAADGDVKVLVGVKGTSDLDVELNFHNDAPFITQVSPLTGTFGDEVVIQGRNFGADIASNAVMLESYSGEIISASPTEIRVKIPMGTNVSELRISVLTNNQAATFGEKFKLIKSVLTGINPEITGPGEEITIYGDYFSPEWNEVTIGGQVAEVISNAKNEIKVRIPDVTSHNPTVVVTTAGHNVSGSVKSMWARIAETIVPPYAATFIHNGFVYSCTGGNGYDTDALFKVDVETGAFDFLPVFPGGARMNPVYFKIGEKGYIGGGHSSWIGTLGDLWEYDFPTEEWKHVSYLPEFFWNTSEPTEAYAVGDRAFVMWGVAMWEYDPTADSASAWTRKADFPGLIMNKPYGFSYDEKLFVFGQLQNANDNDPGKLYQYDPATNQWTYVTATPRQYNEPTFTFVIDDEVYIGSVNLNLESRSFYKYDPVTKQFTPMAPLPGMMKWAGGYLSMNGKGYALGGMFYDGAGTISSSGESWRFNPHP